MPSVAKAREGILHLRFTMAKNGGAGRLRSVSSALQVRHAAIIITAPKENGHDGGICTRGDTGFADRPLRCSGTS